MEIIFKFIEIDLLSNVKIYFIIIFVILYIGFRIGFRCSFIFFINIIYLKNINKIFKMKIYKIRVI